MAPAGRDRQCQAVSSESGAGHRAQRRRSPSPPGRPGVRVGPGTSHRQLRRVGGRIQLGASEGGPRPTRMAALTRSLGGRPPANSDGGSDSEPRRAPPGQLGWRLRLGAGAPAVPSRPRTHQAPASTRTARLRVRITSPSPSHESESRVRVTSPSHPSPPLPSRPPRAPGTLPGPPPPSSGGLGARGPSGR
jgi:hypothetical protein